MHWTAGSSWITQRNGLSRAYPTGLATRGSAKFAEVLLVANAATIKQAGYGLQFTPILEAGITSLMGKSRKTALYAAPHDIGGIPGPDRNPTRPTRPRADKLAHRKHCGQGGDVPPHAKRRRVRGPSPGGAYRNVGGEPATRGSSAIMGHADLYRDGEVWCWYERGHSEVCETPAMGHTHPRLL